MQINTAYDANGTTQPIPQFVSNYCPIPYGRIKVVCGSLTALVIAVAMPVAWLAEEPIITHLPFWMTIGIGIVLGMIALFRIAQCAEKESHRGPLAYLAAVYRHNHIGYEVTAWGVPRKDTVTQYESVEYHGIVHPPRFRGKALQHVTPGRCAITIALGGRHTASLLTYQGVPVPDWTIARNLQRHYRIEDLLLTDCHGHSLPLSAESLLREFDDHIERDQQIRLRSFPDHSKHPDRAPRFPDNWETFFRDIADRRSRHEERYQQEHARSTFLEKRVQELERKAPQKPSATAN
ncbi:hypothetical protein HYV74_03370 [Candidatus Uhrbacteria bacterium]|nr:hypothetical protein [Candidatus Uhrbacteria bacterium]